MLHCVVSNLSSRSCHFRSVSRSYYYSNAADGYVRWISQNSRIQDGIWSSLNKTLTNTDRTKVSHPTMGNHSFTTQPMSFPANYKCLVQTRSALYKVRFCCKPNFGRSNDVFKRSFQCKPYDEAARTEFTRYHSGSTARSCIWTSWHYVYA